MSGEQAHIYAYSTLETRPSDYLIRTVYFRMDEETRIYLLAFEEAYTVEQVDGLFESLRSMIGELPFTQMVNTGIELALFQHLNTHEKFGISPGTGGWEII